MQKFKLILMFIIFSVFSTAFADFHFTQNGPVSASLYYYDYESSALHIRYEGNLIKCDQYYNPNSVDMIIIVTDRFERKVVLKKKMETFCKNPIDLTMETKALYSISPKTDHPLWKRIFINGEFATVEVAFESNGKWDSLGGKNYFLKFKKN